MNRVRTLRARLVLWTMLVNALLLVFLCGLAWVVLRQLQSRQLDDILQLSAAQLASAVDVTGGQLSIPAGDTEILTARGVFVWLLDSTNRINATIGRSKGLSAPALDIGTIRDFQLGPGDNVRLFHARLAESGGSIIVGVSLQSLVQTDQIFVLALGIAVPLVLLLSAAGGLFLAGRALAPITAITAQARRIHHDNLSERLALGGPRDEVHDLAQTFDEMLDRLQSSFEAERRFTADASHELRTPLSLLKAQISLALSHPRDAETLIRMISAMNDDVDRMTRLVQNLLALARSEAPLDTRQPVELNGLLQDLIQQLQAIADQRHISLALEESPQAGAVITGDAEQLARLFMNLLDNAIKYIGDGSGNVQVRIAPSEGKRCAGWVTSIADSGAGIAPEYLPHLFDRFYRADPARARHTGGAGLGLSIAQAIAKQHEGYITVSSQPGHGSVFKVWLPARTGNAAPKK